MNQHDTDNQSRTWFQELSPAGLNVFKILDVATSHIRKEDDMLLEEDSMSDRGVAIVYRKEFGWFVHVCHDMADEYMGKFRKRGYSKEFINVYREALASGAAWICLDSSGSTSSRLTEFSW